MHDGFHVHLIDTPGFDDTNVADIDTLQTIATYLGASYANGIRISGIIYLHRISDNRIGGAGFRNLRMFKKLAGSAAWPNTIIGTTMWRADQHELCLRRESELAYNGHYFGGLVAGGAQLIRVAEHGTGRIELRTSALRIISLLLRRMRNVPSFVLNIQQEMVAESKNLEETAAGKEVLGDIYHLRTQLAAQMENARIDMQEALKARDIKSARQLQDLQTEQQQKLSELQRQQSQLTASLMEIHEKEFQRITARLNQADIEHRAFLQRKEQELRAMEESLQLKRKAAAEDNARWRKEANDARRVQEIKRANRAMECECQKEVATLQQQVRTQRCNVRTINQAQTAVKQNIANGVANGLAAGTTSVVATASEYSPSRFGLFTSQA